MVHNYILKLANFLIASLVFIFAYGQQNIPIVLEAEDGDLGAEFLSTTDNTVDYITITTDGAANHPESSERIATYQVTFPAAGEYDLYIRCRVGSGAFADDSFFYGNGFGTKGITEGNDWIRVNGIPNVGYTSDDMVVDGIGSSGTTIWKWINLSEYTGDEPPVVFNVEEGSLIKSIQIGGREDGLDIDKIAFARADYYYTVENLDNGQEGSSTPPGSMSGTPLADDCGQSKFLGNVYSSSQAPQFLNYWNQVTPENAGKWGSVEGQRDVMNWTQLDNAYNLAKDNDLLFRFHVLIWGNQQPSWIENLSPEEQLEEIKEWFQAVADRYPDIDMIEVVNEPLHDPPNSSGSGGGNYIEALGGNGATGWDWILESFRLAKSYFPNVPLMINDYNIINNTQNTTEYFEIINLLMEENLIDKIGVQGHAFTTNNTIATLLRSNLTRLGNTGLPVIVTELEIDGLDDQVQLEEYQRVFPTLWEHPAVEGITMWGWKSGMWRTDQGAFLIDPNSGDERPSLEWLREYLCSLVSTDEQSLDDNSFIKIYPNPVPSNNFTVENISTHTISEVQLYSLDGRSLPVSIDQKVNTTEVTVGDIPNGTYILAVKAGDTIHHKLIVF